MKKRIILDLFAFIVLIFCMEYNFTGSILHELLGVILFVALAVHVGLNRKYYLALLSGKLKLKNAKTTFACLLNVLLLISLIVMIITSAAISKSLSLGLADNHYSTWRFLHVLSACTLLTTSFVHALMHIPMFRHLKEQMLKGEGSRTVASIVFYALSAIAGLYLVKNNIHFFAKDGKHRGVTQSQIVTDAADSQNSMSSDNNEPISDSGTSVQEDIPSLEEYLGALICQGCGKRCCLLTPRCGYGRRQAQNAVEEYNKTYGIVPEN